MEFGHQLGLLVESTSDLVLDWNAMIRAVLLGYAFVFMFELDLFITRNSTTDSITVPSIHCSILLVGSFHIHRRNQFYNFTT